MAEEYDRGLPTRAGNAREVGVKRAEIGGDGDMSPQPEMFTRYRFNVGPAS